MINAVIELGERRLHEVMVPRTSIVALPTMATFEEAIDTIIDEGHHAVPVYEDIGRRGRRHPVREGPAAVPEGHGHRVLAARRCSGRRSSCRSRCRSTTCSTSSSGARSTSRSCSTSTAARPAWSRSRTCSRRSWARSRTSTTWRSRWSSCSTTTRRVWTAVRRSRTCSRSGTSGARSRTRTSTTPWAGSCTTGSAACPSPGDEILVGGLRMTVETTDGRRVGTVLVVRERLGEDASDPDDE